MSQIAFTIDGNEVWAREGENLLKVALENNFYIPHLCYHKDLTPFGSCRLCIVDVDGKISPSCTTPVKEGMRVVTETPQVYKMRRAVAELLILNHPLDCLTCPKNMNCELQKISSYLGITGEKFKPLRPNLPQDTSNPFFVFDPNKCVLCGRCVRTCHEITGCQVIDFVNRGFDIQVSFGRKPIKSSLCQSCGECVVRCPTAALSFKNNPPPTKEVKSICIYCGLGCGIKLGVRGDKIISIRGDEDSPVSRGELCVRGRFGFEFIHHPERLTKPLIRKDGLFEEVFWEEALDYVARRLGGYRPDEVAVFGSGKCTNEENYLIQKFARTILKTNNIDHCARLCHAPSVTALMESFGGGAMTNPIDDLFNSKLIFVIGINPANSFPVLDMKIRRAVLNGRKLIVANPKEIELSRFADIEIRHRTGSDLPLIMGMCRAIVKLGLQDDEFIRQRCEGYEEFLESLKEYEPEFVEEKTGVPWERIVEAAHLYATVKPGVVFWGMGITQHINGTYNVWALSNLILLTGNVGKQGSGACPVRGHNNVQGACDMGVLPNLLPGYQRLDDPGVADKFKKAWQAEILNKPGLSLMEIIDGACFGRIKAIYLMGGNFALSAPFSKKVIRALSGLEFLVVQDMFLSDTAQLAHVVLPSCSFAEKDGTFTNTERRVQLIRKAIEPIGESKPDWWIICQIARRIGGKGFDFDHPSKIMEEIARLVPIYGGISYQRLERESIQFPCPSPQHPGTPILHMERFARGLGKFIPLKYQPPVETTDEEYPFILTTERSPFHFHTGTITRRVRGLNEMEGEGGVEISPSDARKVGVEDGEFVRVISRRGELRAKAKISRRIPDGVVSMSFHFSETPANMLMSPEVDPISKMPSLKNCPVKIKADKKQKSSLNRVNV